METNDTQKKGCSRPVIVFLSIAVLIVAAFLIVGLVRTCDAEHEMEEIDAVENVQL